ncbi:DUF928 domain-containing protein [Myxosarcina sp. GI1]|uniref:DUF928 domain-containing protein n=1 Tax=Myxosarcina sp. GI1 TaxID=1541065 RepID=UPI0012E085F6|nr:DUF928 domain-containing protein [Myxosarcina sp. GI1]
MMITNNYWRTFKLITTLVIITIVAGIARSSKLLAESVIVSSKSIEFVPPPPPPDRSAAGDRGEAASRGCINSEQPLTALVPSYQQTIHLNKEETIPVTKVWGLTTSEYPTFWFLIPFKHREISSMEFVLKDESQQPSKTIYRNLLTIPETPGIISIATKHHAPSLKISQTNQPKMYHWFLKVRVKCNPQQPAKLHFVEGWIERTNLNWEFGDRLEQLTAIEKAAFYAKKGIWHDAVTNLAELSLANPGSDRQNYAAEWKSLLQSVDLEILANYPLLDCCKFLE